MNTLDVLAVTAVLLTAIAVLPGTLGVLMLTNKIAASPAGARYIYSQSGALIAIAVLLLVYVGVRGYPQGDYSTIALAAIAAVVVLLLYGFLMHAKLLFTPIKEPQYVTVDQAIERFSADEEVVGVIDENGKPYAYIARLARRPHIVYQPDGDAPFLMTHCILAHSSMSYALEGNFRNPDITITAALANNMVFYEKSSRCSVVQIHNRLEGTNEPLKTVPTIMTSLASWKKYYPDSPVWMRSMTWRDTFYLTLLARADVIDPASSVMVYPLQHERDERLSMKSCVVGLLVEGQARAYPVASVEAQQVINDQLGGQPVAIFSDGDFIQVCERNIEQNTVLTFVSASETGQFIDKESGSTWASTGECIAGKYQGRQLSLVPHYNKIFWYVWSDYFPGGDVFETRESSSAAA
jgi:hypothetical protein